jgi:hypothetical protein
MTTPASAPPTADERLEAARDAAAGAQAALAQATADRAGLRTRILRNQGTSRPSATATARARDAVEHAEIVAEAADAELAAATSAVRAARVAELRDRFLASRRGDEAARAVGLYADAADAARALDGGARAIAETRAALAQLGAEPLPAGTPLPQGESLAWGHGLAGGASLIVDGRRVAAASIRDLGRAGEALSARRAGLPVPPGIPKDIAADPEEWARRSF